MARRRTIKELEEDIRWQADQQEAELRHTSVDIRKAINQSIQRFRERFSDNGHPYYLRHHAGVLPTGPGKDDTGEEFNFGVLDIGGIFPEVVRIYGLDVKVNNGVSELDSVEFGQRNLYNYINGSNNLNSIPEAFFGYDETKIGLLPPSKNAYPFVLWYLPRLEDLMEDDDEFNPGIPGAENWVIWDVFVKLLTRDNYPRLISTAMTEREVIWMEILKRASKHQRASPPKRIDSRGRTKDKRWNYYRFWSGTGQ